MIIKTKFDIGQKVWVNDETEPKEVEIWYIRYWGNLIQYKFKNNSSAPENRVYTSKEEALLNHKKDRRDLDYDYNTAHKKQAKS